MGPVPGREERAASRAGQGQAGKGAIRLFRILGIDVWLHWSWIVVALFEIQDRRGAYHSQFWNIAEYITLFAIVLLHEFGHALACRSVGGMAEEILLWPMGGVAYVLPPSRPGAQLWSIAAGPLVNAALVPVTVGAQFLVRMGALPLTADAAHYLRAVIFMNLGLLIFNLLPAYPLDGGKILRSLLWFIIGEVRSLQVAAGIGLVCGAGLLLVGVYLGSYWWMILAAYGGLQSWSAFKLAREVVRATEEMRSAPTHLDARCPTCGMAPPVGPHWVCSCGEEFDAFAHRARCPRCEISFPVTRCPRCSELHPMARWLTSVPPASAN